MASQLPGLAINNDLHASGGEKARNPVDPSVRETQVAEQVMKKQPIDSIKGLGDVHLKQNARDASGMKELNKGLDSSKVVVNYPFIDESALFGRH
jgi:hypothetical protein